MSPEPSLSYAAIGPDWCGNSHHALSTSPLLSLSLSLSPCRNLWLQSCRITTTIAIINIILVLLTIIRVINELLYELLLLLLITLKLLLYTLTVFILTSQSWNLMVHNWSLSPLSPPLLPLPSISLSSLPSFHPSLLSSPFFPAPPSRSRQMESGSVRGFFQLMREFFLYSRQSPAHCGNCWVSL